MGKILKPQCHVIGTHSFNASATFSELQLGLEAEMIDYI